MTDKEMQIDIFKRAGVVFFEEPTRLEVTAKEGPNNLGYTGFVCEFVYDSEGKLLNVSVYE